MKTEKSKTDKKERCKFIFLISVLTFLLIVPYVNSLGITPGRTTINYEKALEKEISFSVLNNEHKNMEVLLMVQGELNDSVTLFDGLINFTSDEESKSFKYKIKLSDKISLEPGLHSAEIIALEFPKESEEGTYIRASISVVSQIHVYVSCPGKCIEADIDILSVEQNGIARFVIPVINRGKLRIENVRAIIDIYSKSNEKIETIETDSLSIGAGQRSELTAEWNADVLPGNYLAKFILFYDGESKNFEKEFSVGSEILNIESILVNNFQLGEIAKLNILVENKLNQELKNVFAALQVYNKDSQAIADIKSPSENIPALNKKELIAYWDTGGVEEGEYSGRLMVRYGEKSTDKNLILKISESSLDIFGVGYAISPKGRKGMDITIILIVLVIILLIANLSWFIFFRRMSRKK